MTVAPNAIKITALIGVRAVIFFFYLRFFKFAIITIKTKSTISASVVIICKARVLVKIHRHQLLSLYYERSKKNTLLSFFRKEQPPP